MAKCRGFFIGLYAGKEKEILSNLGMKFSEVGGLFALEGEIDKLEYNMRFYQTQARNLDSTLLEKEAKCNYYWVFPVGECQKYFDKFYFWLKELPNSNIAELWTITEARKDVKDTLTKASLFCQTAESVDKDGKVVVEVKPDAVFAPPCVIFGQEAWFMEDLDLQDPKVTEEFGKEAIKSAEVELTDKV